MRGNRRKKPLTTAATDELLFYHQKPARTFANGKAEELKSIYNALLVFGFSWENYSSFLRCSFIRVSIAFMAFLVDIEPQSGSLPRFVEESNITLASIDGL